VFDAIEAENPHFIPNMTLVQMVEVSEDPKKIERLHRMNWQVVDLTGASHDLVLGDRAFLLHGSLMDAGPAVVALPLSPTRLLSISDRPLKQMPKSELVKIINRESTMRAVEHIFAADRQHVALAEKHLRERQSGRSGDLLDY
jgi:hypothetical protein